MKKTRVIVNEDLAEEAFKYALDNKLECDINDLYDYFDTSLNKVAFFFVDFEQGIHFAKRFQTTAKII